MVRYLKTESKLLRYVQVGLALSFFAFVLSSGLAACGKKSNDTNNLTSGSLTSDGFAVSSNTTVGGYPLSLVISNIQPTGGTGFVNNQCYWNGYQTVCGQQQQQQQQAQCYNQYGQYICGNGIAGAQSLIFTVQINGQSQQLNVAMNSSNGYSQRNQAQVGGFQVLYQAACYTVDCAEVLLEVVVSGGTYDYRQIGIRRNNSQGKIVKLGEWQASYSTLRSIQQIMTEM